MSGPILPLISYGGVAAPVGLVWTARGDVTASQPVVAIGSNAGTTLLVDANGVVYKSTDGGHSWTPGTTIAGFNPPSVAQLKFGNGVWLLSAGADTGAGTVGFSRSTDGGNTWTLINSHVVSAGTVWIATDGAGVWVATANVIGSPLANPNFARSTDNGATWVTANPFAGGTLTDIFWDGAKFVGVGLTSTGAPQVATSTDHGVTWTLTPTTNQLTVTTLFQTSYVGAGTDSGGTFAASFSSATAVGLAVAAPVHTGLNSGGVDEVLAGPSLCFSFDAVGGVANTATLSAWAIGTLNLPPADNVNQGCANYDSVNASFIAGGTTGNVVTYP